MIKFEILTKKNSYFKFDFLFDSSTCTCEYSAFLNISVFRKKYLAMGRPFLEHMGGKKYYTCFRCKTYLTNRKEVLSHTFRGATGQAYLFRNVVNIISGRVESRFMITGQHMVRDVFCKNCNFKLGWMYEFAHEPLQQYKEGRVILERKLLDEREETDPGLAERNRPLTRTSSSSSVSSSGISSVTIT